jgi:hypothetical protein
LAYRFPRIARPRRRCNRMNGGMSALAQSGDANRSEKMSLSGGKRKHSASPA